MGINDKIDYLTQIAYSTRETLMSTYALAQQMMSVYGCFVECGVGAGANLMAMKLACVHGGKIVWGFDSFQGIPLAGPKDGAQPGMEEIEHDVHQPITKRMISSGVTVHSRDNVLANFTTAGIPAYNVNLVQGWFINTLAKSNTGAISLLRLDGDLYESTAVALEILYPRVSSGGVVIIDDYGLKGAHQAVHDYFGGNLPTLIGEGVVHFYKP